VLHPLTCTSVFRNVRAPARAGLTPQAPWTYKGTKERYGYDSALIIIITSRVVACLSHGGADSQRARSHPFSCQSEASRGVIPAPALNLGTILLNRADGPHRTPARYNIYVCMYVHI